MAQSTTRRVARCVGAVSLVLTASLAAACSSSSSGSSGSAGGGGKTAPIVLGASGPLSGPASSLSVLYDGMRAYFDKVNKAGGIDGHKVELKVGDDQFSPANTPAIMRKLVQQDKILMSCGTAGSDTAAAVQGYLTKQGVPTIPSAGSSNLTSGTSYLQLPTYTPLAAQMAEYAVDTLKQTKIAIAYSDDAVGDPTRDGAEQEMTKLGVKPVAVVTFNAAATDQSTVAAKLKSSGATFVLMNHAAPQLSGIINAASQIGFKPTWGILWPAENKGLVSLTHGALTDNVYVSTPFPLYSSPAAADYRAAMKTYAPRADMTDTITMLGWSTADTCVQVLKASVKAASGDLPTRSQVLKAMSTLKYSDAYVRGLDWSTGSHSGQNQAQIVRLSGGTYHQTSGFQHLPSVTESS